jgi:hypothetical protein
MRSQILVAVPVLAPALVAGLSPRSVASQTSCPPLARSGPTIINVSVISPGTAPAAAGDLVVPPDVSCSLADGQHVGNIAVHPGGALSLTNMTVTGDIRAEGASSTAIESSRVAGNLRVEGGGSATPKSSEVGGVVLIDGATAGVVVRRNTIGGALLVGHSGETVEIAENSVGRELRCDSNRGELTVEANTVQGAVDPACLGG